MSETDDLQVDGPSSHDDSTATGTPVVVRRNAGLSALVGAAASAIAIAYLWRATADGALLDWALCVVMAAIGAIYLANLVDARTPLLVADDLGIRIRLGRQWRGLPWDAVDRVVVAPRHGVLRDGRLLFAPHSLSRALDGLDARGRRAAALNQRLYGAALAVPMGLTTRVSVPGRALVDELTALTQGQVDVSLMEPEPATEQHADPTLGQQAEPSPEPAPLDLEAPFDQDASEVAAETEVRRTRWAPFAGRRSHDEPLDGSLGDSLDEDEEGDEDGDADVEVTEEIGAYGLFDEPADEQPPAQWQSEAEAERAWHDLDEPEQPGEAPESDTGPDEGSRRPRRSLLGGLGALVSRAGRGRDHDVDAGRQEDGDLVGDPVADPVAEVQPEAQPVEDVDIAADAQHDAEPEALPDGDDVSPVEPEVTVPDQPAARGAVPLRLGRRTLRAGVAPEQPAAVHGNAALLPEEERSGLRGLLPERHHLRRGADDEHVGEVDDGRVRPIARLGDPVDSLVVDDFVTQPAYDPVIGPELAAARTRVGLSVDELAERTRIRPHVIESIEVDDFAPCGGDFYARGHLRTLARVLGREPEPLLALFDNRYATAPINAKRVFEAELATGMTGSMRSTRGGPNWSLLIGVVLALVLTWGVIRLFATQPAEVLQPVAPSLNGSAGVGTGSGQAAAPATPKPMKVLLTGAHEGSEVVVRDRSGKVVWAGEVVPGEKHLVSAVPPVKVKAANGGAIDVTTGGADQGTLGLLGEPGTRTFTRSAG